MSLRNLREEEESSLAGRKGWGREGGRRVRKGSLWRASQQVFSKQFPRRSCLPKPPIRSEEARAALRTWPGYSWHPPVARSKSERVS